MSLSIQRASRVSLTIVPNAALAMHALLQANIEIDLVVSTSHMRWETDRTLSNVDSDLRKQLAVVDYHGDGWLFRVYRDAARVAGELGFDDLAKMLVFALEAGATKLIFDQAVDTLPPEFGLPVFDWDEESGLAAQAAAAEPAPRHKLVHALEIGIDPTTDLPVLGVTANDVFVFTPFQSECGRFDVDPAEAYGMSTRDAKQLDALNLLANAATMNAISAGCKTVQMAFGVAPGVPPDLEFSAPEKVTPVARAMIDYILALYEKNGAPVIPPYTA